MGGNAFNKLLGSESASSNNNHSGANLKFPRMPPPVYQALKARLLPKLQDLYEYVASPHEVPEKKDHGDLDFSVACLKSAQPSSSVETQDQAIINTSPDRAHTLDLPHETVKSLFNAVACNPKPGNRTSNFAIRVEKGEWAAFGEEFGEWERRVREASLAADEKGEGEIYYQVGPLNAFSYVQTFLFLFWANERFSFFLLGRCACMY
jgi:hypothetical protein